MVMAEDTKELEKIVERVRKLLSLAAGRGTEAEAASATAKAQELLAAYNLDMSTIEQGGGKREDARVRGGMYIYERELWRQVAELNFCLHFVSRVRTEVRPHKFQYLFHHRVVGRTVNVRSTHAMAGYLQQTIERLCRERLGPDHGRQFYSAWAVAYREGMAARVGEKLFERRQHLLQEEVQKEKAAERAARAAARKGVSTATALTIGSLTKSEKEANEDFIYGEGYTAEKNARRARRAEAEAEAEREYAQWAATHPEEVAREAKRMAAERRKRWSRPAGRRRERAWTDAERRQDSGAYYAGYDKGDEISIEPQVDRKEKQRRIAR